MDVVFAAAYDVAKMLIGPVGRHIGYAWYCQDNIANVRDEILVNLRDTELSSMQRVMEKDKKGGNKIERKADNWRSDVEKLINQAEEFLSDEGIAKKKCVAGLCPDWKARYHHGREAKKMLDAAENLKVRKQKMGPIAFRELLTGIPTVEDFEVFESRKAIFDDIMQELQDPNVTKIGIFGITGVGKTTLAMEIAAQAYKKNLIEEFAIATVSRDHNLKDMQGGEIVKRTSDLIKEIQLQIKDGLHFQFSKEMEHGRAHELGERLKDEKRKLVLLDNISEGFELEHVGIPSKHEKCKILMTSTNEKILEGMRSEKNFSLHVLEPYEAHEWFAKLVGDVITGSRMEEIAKKVADKCAGLPLSLVTAARGVKKKRDLSSWTNALNQLSTEGPVRLSYNLLEGEEIKKFFLLCAQLPPDRILVESLLRYSWGMGIFKKCETLGRTRERLLAYVDDLRASALLIEDRKDKILEMRDVVHNFAVSLSSDHHFFTVVNELDEWPAKDKFEQFTEISLPFCKIPKLEEFECPALKLFILYATDPSMEIPDKFFEKMKKLRVLDVTEMEFPSLPPSLGLLTKLKTLCLDFCNLENTVNMAIIGNLKKLEILSLWGSDIVQLPNEISQLTQLRLLDLSFCQRLEVIPIDILSCLTKLEELYMRDILPRWEIKALKSRREISNLAKPKLLPNLCTLEVHITDANILPKDLSFEKLERFTIFIGDGWDWYWSSKNPTSRTLKIKFNASNKLDKAVKTLIRSTEDLYLNNLEGNRNSLCELDFLQLRHLHVENSHEVQYIINSMAKSHYSDFTILESLSLDNLENLEKICCGKLMPKSFSKLKMLEVRSCDGLKCLFPFSVAENLSQLEEMKITKCKIIEEIVRDESEAEDDRKKSIVFPRLRVLTLKYLPQFARFCSEIKSHSISETGQKLSAADVKSDEIVPENVAKFPTPVFDKKSCFGSIFCSQVMAPSISGTGQKLPATDVRSQEITSENCCEAPMTLFNKMVVFPKLKNLKLKSLNFEKIWSDKLIEISSVQNLTSLVLDGCNNLKYFISSAMVKSLMNLRELEICNCKKIEEIIFIERSGEEIMQVFDHLDFLKLMDLPKLAQFCRIAKLKCLSLKSLLIGKCPELREFISISTTVGSEAKAKIVNSALFDRKVELPSLERLEISDMHSLERIWDSELHGQSFSKLKVIVVKGAKELGNVFSPNYMISAFQNLESLYLEGCNSLEEVFDLQGLITLKLKENVGVSSKLKTLTIKSLPNLKRIWSEEARGYLSFQKLFEVTAFECPNLKSLFPAFIARGLHKLARLDVETCGVEEIVSEEGGQDPSVDIEFHELTYLRLWQLPQLKSFYPGCSLEWPKLKILRLFDCDKMDIFSMKFESVPISLEDGIRQQPLFTDVKVIYQLEELTLDSKYTMLLDEESSTEPFSLVKCLHLQYFNDSTEFPFGLIQRFRNLEALVVVKSCFKEMFACEGPIDEGNQRRSLPQIKQLGLHSLDSLEQIKLDHILEKCNILCVSNCKNLIHLVPSSSSFQSLKILDVRDCESLESLIKFSTAESFVHLTKISLHKCKMLREIIANEEGQIKKEISFPKLESVTLYCLTSLTSFCSDGWIVRFPSLEEVTVTQCPRMTIFSQGELHAPKLRTIKAGDEKHWKGELNATIKHMYEEKVGFNGLEQLQLSEFPELKHVWHDPEKLQVSFFHDLKSLVVNECPSFHSAVPSNLLPVLNVLEELEVRNSELVEEVFDMEQPNADEVVERLPNLKKLNLIDLQMLRHVWNENPRTTLNFKNLRVLRIQNCKNLRYVFSLNMVVSGLVQLQEIEVKSCGMVEEIIQQGEAQEAIKFPLLNSIVLESLRELKSFYSGSGTVECPCLKSVTIIDCPSSFTLTFLREKAPNATNEMTRRKVEFPSLENLRVEWNDALEEFWLGQCQAEFFRELKIFEVIRFPPKRRALPAHFLGRLPILEKLIVSDASFEEIILHERTNDHNESDQNVVLAQLKELELSKLPNLTLLSRNDNPKFVIFQNLEALRVLECGILKILVPSFACLARLKVLEVSNCHKMDNLMLTSTAKTLVQLTVLSVTECDKMEEIIASEENGSETDITFEKLKCLKLLRLQNIKGFYSGKSAFIFPSLEEVQARECDKMEFFSHGAVSIPKLRIMEGKDKEWWAHNLNAPKQHMLEEMVEVVAQSEPPSSVSKRTSYSRTQTEGNDTFPLFNGQALNDMHVGENTDTAISLTTEAEITIRFAVEEQVITCASEETEIAQLDMISKDTYESKVVSSKSSYSQSVMHNVTNIAAQTQANHQADIQNELAQKQILPASSIQQRCTDAAPGPNAVEQGPLSTSSIYSQPRANFDSLFSSIEELLKLSQESSFQPASSSFTPEFHEYSGASPGHYSYSMDLIEKILKKTLAEVATSTDAPLLLTNLKILKNSPVLNSEQSQAIQYYIENFDSLVTSHSYYEHQMDICRALELYNEENEGIAKRKEGIAKVKMIYDDLTSEISTLSASKEDLKRRLHEIEKEEGDVQAKLQVLYADMVHRKGELENYQNIRSEAAREQSEAVDKANKANHSWVRLRSLFPSSRRQFSSSLFEDRLRRSLAATP